MLWLEFEHEYFIETPRLLVKPPSEIDFEAYYGLLSDPEVMRYIGKGIRTREEARENLESQMNHFNKHGFGLWFVYEKQTGLFVGRAGLVYLEMKGDQPAIEISYALHQRFWNQGYGKELVKACIHWGFQHLSVNQLLAVIHPDNERSRRVLERVGMHYWGLKNYYQTEVAQYFIDKSTVDAHKIQLIPVLLDDYPIIQNLARFYAYDMSEFWGGNPGWEVPENGLYECIDFRKYWEDPYAFPFLIRYDGELAGFAIVNKSGSEPGIDFVMAQFFIMRKFKRQGIGRQVAYQCFDRFPGVWEVMVFPGNEGSYRFWRAVIKHYCGHPLIEYTRQIAHFSNKTYNIFKFESGKTQ